MGLVYVSSSVQCTRSLTQLRKVLDPVGAITVHPFPRVIVPRFSSDTVFFTSTDWHWHQLRLDLQDLQGIRVVGRKIRPS